jgi:hypothetical protein
MPHESGELCSQSKRRFDPNRPRILDSEALRSLFGFPSESKVEDEKETDPPIGEHHILKHYAGYHYHSGRKTRLSRYFLAAEQLNGAK